MRKAFQQAQTIFSGDLPVVPLYWRLEVAAARTDVCHFSLDPTASSALWNIDQHRFRDFLWSIIWLEFSMVGVDYPSGFDNITNTFHLKSCIILLL